MLSSVMLCTYLQYADHTDRATLPIGVNDWRKRRKDCFYRTFFKSVEKSNFCIFTLPLKQCGKHYIVRKLESARIIKIEIISDVLAELRSDISRFEG